MSAREEILRAVRAARETRPEAIMLPPLDMLLGERDASGDAGYFAHTARAGGARVVECTRAELARTIAAELHDATLVLSRVAEVAGTVGAVSDPHDLAALDAFVCEARFGVAENGATWLPASALGERAALWLATHVVVVLDRTQVVADMHAACVRLALGDEAFGTFVAGPSKTADIEQSLVVGAHGAKRHTVVIVAAQRGA